MDQGPFRMPRPADRSANRERPVERTQPPATPKHAEPEPPKPARNASASRPAAKSKSKKPWTIIAAILLVVIIAVGGYFFWNNTSNSGNSGIGIDNGKFQAVFFTNGQVYFGKLTSSGGDYMKLTDIFYLQTQQDSGNPQKTSGSDSNASNVQLVKLGSEIHGPEDEMIIDKSQVLFFENLKSDGKVAQSISTYEQNKK